MLAAISGTVPPLRKSFEGCRFAPRCDRAFSACSSTPPELTFSGESQVRGLLYVDGEVPKTALGAPASASLRFAAARVGCTVVPPLLDVRGVGVRFPIRRGLLQRSVGAFVAVDDGSFAIGPGQTLALVGDSGCAKWTTGKAIVQLLRGQSQVSGTTIFGGVDFLPCKASGSTPRGVKYRSF